MNPSYVSTAKAIPSKTRILRLFFFATKAMREELFDVRITVYLDANFRDIS